MDTKDDFDAYTTLLVRCLKQKSILLIIWIKEKQFHKTKKISKKKIKWKIRYILKSNDLDATSLPTRMTFDSSRGKRL